ncbi:phage portal protein [Paenibacillus sp. alder61]|uniref:Phage portal protein n=1 Tax=Paenibacillus faecis TaxID=862114 RepID=A0A5D0CS57_9BACL|nr:MULTISPECIES: phage portal protein [Paenibacillus]MCA1293711.1 phage portal protein [Paenibacillus sp. alder61]TYA12816.1 phage portal protein [Paenibacillus faecis]
MSYEVVLQNKYDLRELVESITLTDSLDQIAYQASIAIKVPADFPGIEPGHEIRISGVPFGASNRVPLLHPGVVWDCGSTAGQTKHMNLTVYDRTIYLAKSEDECLFAKGGTASQRLKQHAANWSIKLASVPDTKTKLNKAVYRAQTIYSMIMADLKETVKSGGDMFIPRMTSAGLELFKIGGNKTVWRLEGIEEATQSRTLEETVTRVKVLGSSADENAPSKVLAIASGQTAEYGVLQRIVQDENVKTADAAKKLAESMLTGKGLSYSVSCIDLNTVRAGDQVNFNGLNLIVTSVSHQLGDPGHMTLELATYEDVKRRYFLEH